MVGPAAADVHNNNLPVNPFKLNRRDIRFAKRLQRRSIVLGVILIVTYVFGQLAFLSIASERRPLPVDGPSTHFEADPEVAKVLAVQQNPQDREALTAANNDFGLVLLTGWPPKNDIMSFYQEFLKSVRQCFDPEDLDGSHGQPAAVYLAPPEYLHVTVATLHSYTRPTNDNPEQRKVLKRYWKDIVVKAALRPEWPTHPLELVVDAAQLGTRAGIILWKERTGGLDAMRHCIRQETHQRHDELLAVGIDPNTLALPNIVHSTFLRFYRVPQTSGQVVQERFKSQMTLPRLQQAFPSPVTFDSCRLICERMPFVHFPNDDHHVFLTLSLNKDGTTTDVVG